MMSDSVFHPNLRPPQPDPAASEFSAGGAPLVRVSDDDMNGTSQAIERLTGDVIRYWIERYCARHHGRFPTARGGRIPESTVAWSTRPAAMTWSGLNKAMQQGLHGFEERITLAGWIRREFDDAPNLGRASADPLPPEVVTGWINEFVRAHEGTFPRTCSGAIAGTDLCWKRLDQSMRRGSRGFAPGTTLHRWIALHCKEVKVISVLTEELIVSWVDAYRYQHQGDFPGIKSGPITGTHMTWSGLNAAMIRGSFGFALRTRLVAWLRHRYPDYPVNRGGRPRAATLGQPAFTLPQIITQP